MAHYRAGFPVVGIGASAGGLEALEEFFKNVPENCGMAFVIVQHLDPTHKAILAEILQRSTPMPVVQISDRQKVRPDHVYVIPPNKDISILHGTLHLLEPSAVHGLRLPIDFFFRSLADDMQERSIGVILSGMGSDGALGLRTIKEKGGVVLVQKPDSARFEGMPRSAIETGLADVVVPVEELPGRIISYLHHAPLIPEGSPGPDSKTQSSMEKIIILLRRRTGHDFSLYKQNTIYRRIERRMGIQLISRIQDYVRYLQENPQEAELLFKELLIGVTSFFRDPSMWEKLKAEVIPALLKRHGSGNQLRAWVPGCSTGEEAYSLAMVFREVMDDLKTGGNFSLQIFATDLDGEAISKARTGIFPRNIATDVKPERLARFFIEADNGYQVSKSIREMVVFAPQNVMMDPPFTKLDILSCRNLLIYLTAEVQKKLLPLFHYSLKDNGCLVLGSAESIGNFSELFEPVNGRTRIYRKIERPATDTIDFPSSFVSIRTNSEVKTGQPLIKPQDNLQALADQLLMKNYSPSAVMTNDKGDIVYFSGRTGKYLEPAAGKVNLSLFAMAREELRYELISAFQKALRSNTSVRLSNLSIGGNGGKKAVDIIIQPISEPENLRGMIMVVFIDVPAPVQKENVKDAGKGKASKVHNVQIKAMEMEIDRLRMELQSTREEMQTSQEELKSSNEELQSSNEELQSTNEELTTSKEEMQSMNEELQTLNFELRSKVDELSQSSADMKNLIDSMQLATIFLDSSLKVRRFTFKTTEIIKLITGDVGRPITDIANELEYPEFIEDMREVLRTLVFREKEIPASGGRWFLTRIMPYRTLEDKIDGLVITFTDISVSKKLEMELRNVEGSEGKQIK